ncbi:MAG: extracellular solute-binding protein [Limnochordia bacterium]|nr:extracellular solute-binding protein [Limnochordia bacterium]
MRKVTLCFVSVLIVVCSSFAFAGKPIEIEFWTPFSIRAAGETMDELVNTFNETHPGVHVTHRVQGSEVFWEKVALAVVGGFQPDISWAAPVKVLDESIVVPMERLVEESEYDTSVFWPRLWKGISIYKGIQWGFPFEVGSQALMYNKEGFASAGIAEPPSTWSEQLATAKKLTQPEKGIYGTQVSSQHWNLVQLVWRNGADIVSEDGTKVTLTDPRTAQAIQWHGELDSVHGVVGGSLLDGTCMMHIEHPGWYKDVLSRCSFEWGVAVPPIPDEGGVRASLSYIKNLTIFRSTKEREQASWTFVQWLMEPEQLALWCTRTGYLPVRRDVLDTERYQAYLAENPMVIPWIEELSYINDPEWPRNISFEVVQQYLPPVMDLVRRGEQDASVAFEEIELAVQTKVDEALRLLGLN